MDAIYDLNNESGWPSFLSLLNSDYKLNNTNMYLQHDILVS